MSNNGVITKKDGKAYWTPQNNDRYLVTGTDRKGKRFRIESNCWQFISGINVYRGSKWLLRDGKRYLIQRRWN